MGRVQWQDCDPAQSGIYMSKADMCISSAEYLVANYSEKGCLSAVICCIHAAHFFINGLCAKKLLKIPSKSTPHTEMQNALVEFGEITKKDQNFLSALFDSKNKWEYLRTIPKRDETHTIVRETRKIFNKVLNLLS